MARAVLDLVGTPSLIALTGNELILGTAGNNALIFVTNGVERLRIAGDGTTTLAASVDFTLANDDFLLAKDSGGSSVDVLRVRSTDYTQLNSKSGKGVQLSVGGTVSVTAESGALILGATSHKIVAGATSLLFRNNADTATNLSITDAGLLTSRSHIYPLTDGNLDLGGTSSVWNNLYVKTVQFIVAGGKFIGGTSNTAFRNNANDADNLVVLDSGQINVPRGDITFGTNNSYLRGNWDGSAVNRSIIIAAGNTGSTAQGAIVQLSTTFGASGMLDLYHGTGGTIRMFGSSGSGYVGVSGTSSPSILQVSPQGASRNIKMATQTLSGLSGATAVTSGLVPAKSRIVGVVVRVTTAVEGATGFNIGDGTDADRFGANIAIAAGTTTSNADFTADPSGWASGAQEVTLTALGSNFTAGAVRIVAYYEDFTGPAS